VAGQEVAFHDAGMTGDAFGFDTTTDEVLEGVDLTGTTALVTGASAGLGVETVRVLAAHGATVIATARDLDKATRALTAAGVELGDPVRLEELDLASLASVRSFTDRIMASEDHLDLLFANAGVMACPKGTTEDGFETHFGTNHLGHFVLVNRLVPLVVAAAPSRIICLSSSGHRIGDVDLGDPNFESTPYHEWLAYGRSKTANAQFAVELDRRLRDRGVRAVAVHPGGIQTELMRHLDADALAFVESSRQREWKTPQQGAATAVWAAIVADADEVGGRFVEDCHVAEVFDGDGRPPPGHGDGVRSYVYDPGRASALWTRSEELVGETFAI
jgi:NAD(P)-dependent dehydrogenase (short-subunit alcohol dehydrogenase family)